MGYGLSFTWNVEVMKMPLHEEMPTFANYRSLVLDQRPLIDVRAPVEFAKGAFPYAVNLPLMDDGERHRVGKCYKEQGRDEAVKLGYALVSGAKKEQRIQAWLSHLQCQPTSLLYCFRGGMRSQIAQRWIYEASGHWVPRLAGGYKDYRNFLRRILEPTNLTMKPVLIGGYTGSGKTVLLQRYPNTVDLEGLANHRGSAFGRHLTEQPVQIDFEHSLAYRLYHLEQRSFGHMLLEDEGNHIGRCYLPQPLVRYFASGDFLLLHVPFAQRVQQTVAEYVHQAQDEYSAVYGADEGLLQWAEYVRTSIGKLRKRLGEDRYNRLLDVFTSSLNEQQRSGSLEQHSAWVEALLLEYYDPMYRYQLENKQGRIAFTGTAAEMAAYIVENYQGKLQVCSG